MIQSLNQLPKWMLWGLALPLITLNAWVLFLFFQYFESLITIAVAAALLSFILDYPVQWIQQLKLDRTRSVLVVVLVVLVGFAVLGITVVPTLISQLNELAMRLPSWLDSGNQQLLALQQWAAARQLPIDLAKIVGQLEDQVTNQLRILSGTLLSIFFSTIGRVLDVILTTVLTIYLLLHGDRLWDGLLTWFPQPLGNTIRQVIRQNFHNYFVGQVTLAGIVTVIMTSAFVLIQVPFGLLFGIGIGLLALFPFGKSVGITIVTVLTSLKSIWLGVRVAVVAVIIDQVIESVVTPQLIGRFTGLNPVWILISLLIGTKVGGVLGLVVAVPFASSLKNLADILRASSAAELAEQGAIATPQPIALAE